MNDQEINMAIAEACGWMCNDKGWWFNATGTNGGDSECPDYCHDLNAMHDAEIMLTFDKQTRMCRIVGMHDVWLLLHANARQRAEAFLLTIGKWRE